MSERNVLDRAGFRGRTGFRYDRERMTQSFPIDRSHIAPVTTREELIYLLSHACELEHGVACIYLFAAYSLKSDASEGGMTPEQAEMVRGWKRRLVGVGVEEMLHLAQLTNVLTAIGGAPHFRRTNFPVPRSALPINDHMTLEPFSIETIERFMAIEMPEPGLLPPDEQIEAEQVAERVRERRGRRPKTELRVDPTQAGCEPFDIDFATQGEFYHKLMSGIACIPEDELFIGPPEAQANARFIDFQNKLRRVVDRKSALEAIQMVIEQGEAPTRRTPMRTFGYFGKSGASTARRMTKRSLEAAYSSRPVPSFRIP